MTQPSRPGLVAWPHHLIDECLGTRPLAALAIFSQLSATLAERKGKPPGKTHGKTSGIFMEKN